MHKFLLFTVALISKGEFMMRCKRLLILLLVALVASVAAVASATTATSYTQSDLYCHYKFDDTSGTAFTDSSNNGVDADFYRHVTYAELPGVDVSNVTATGQYGNALGLGVRSVGGVDTQILGAIPASTNLPGAGDSFAVSFWYNVDDWNTAAMMIASYNMNGLEWTLGGGGNGLMYAWSGDADATGNASYNPTWSGLTASTYNHFVVQFNGTAGVTDVWINGEHKSDDADYSFWGSEREGLTLGARVLDARDYGVANHNPYLDDFAIVSGVVDATDVDNLMSSGGSSLGTRCLAQYAMNEVSGTQITDSSTNANNGTLVGYDPASMGLAVRDVSTASRDGKFGNSAEIASGWKEYAKQQSVDHMPVKGEDFTVCFWLKPDEVISDVYGWDSYGVIYNWANDDLGFSVTWGNEGDGSIVVRRTDGDYSNNSALYGVYIGENNGMGLSTDEFHHFAVTVNEAGAITGIYVDGQYVAKQINNGFGITDEETGIIGNRIKNGSLDALPLCAYVDDLAVIAGELDAAQIQLIMAEGVEEAAIPEPSTMALLLAMFLPMLGFRRNRK